MSDTFDGFEFFDFLRGRWWVAAGACGVALLLSVAGSLLQAKRYTATASIVIEPPAGSDVRTATAVSPVYLESLRTYERFATSDTLFARAVERFQLQPKNNSQPIETLKRRVLKVIKVRDTKILELSITLTDPQLAQKLVQYLAEQTVLMSRNEDLAADQERIEDATRQVVESQSRLAKSRTAWTESAPDDSIAALQSNIDADTEVLAKVRREQMGEGPREREELAARLAQLEKAMARDSAAMARRIAHREALEMDLNSAQTAFERAAEHLREVQSNEGSHGERLRVIDPGIVPQRPSSPNVMLNVLSALLFALTASLIYISMAFAMRRRLPVRSSETPVRRAFRL